MAAVTDPLHDEEVADAVLQYLCGVAAAAGTIYPSGQTGTLPTAWKTKDHKVLGLQLVELGRPDWMALGASLTYNPDGSIASADFSRVKKFCPAIFVHVSRTQNAGGGLGGKQDVTCPLRLVHIRWWSPDLNDTQCRATTDKLGATVVAGPTSWQSPDRARTHYAKIVVKALGQSRTLNDPAFTCADISASLAGGEGVAITEVVYEGEDLPPDPSGGGGPIGFAIHFIARLFVK